jgi:excinuclease ABC subunit C
MYYGPFPRVKTVAHTVRELGQALGLRDCSDPTPVFFHDQLEMFEGDRIPNCIRADFRSCLAPCCGRPAASQYQAAVDLARQFLEGKGGASLAELEREMADASRRMDFEYAALLCDRIERLRRFRDELVVFRGAVEDLTFVYRVPGFAGNDRIYLVRRGRIRKDMAHPKTRRARDRVARAIDAVYGAVDPGPRGLSPQDAAEILLIARWFRLNPKERGRTLAPHRWLEEKGPGR